MFHRWSRILKKKSPSRVVWSDGTRQGRRWQTPRTRHLSWLCQELFKSIWRHLHVHVSNTTRNRCHRSVRGTSILQLVLPSPHRDSMCISSMSPTTDIILSSQSNISKGMMESSTRNLSHKSKDTDVCDLWLRFRYESLCYLEDPWSSWFLFKDSLRILDIVP